MSDLIDRQDAIDALYHVDEYNGRSIEAIRNLPSAERHGRWIDVEPAPHNLFYATCSVCGDRQMIEVANYCPMCGASLRGEEK